MVPEESRPRGRGRPPKPLDADGSSAARLGSEVRRYREQRGLTQVVLAGLMGYSPQHLSALELGEGSVSEQFVQACDDALGANGRLVELLPGVVYERAQARWLTARGGNWARRACRRRAHRRLSRRQDRPPPHA
jgi:transcriptional regulator with XRE-family HTH domain